MDGQNATQDDVKFPEPTLRLLLPERDGAFAFVQLIEDWLQSSSELLLLSGPPGAGKSKFLNQLQAEDAANHIRVEDEPSPTASFLDQIGAMVAQEFSTGSKRRIAIATQIRARDPRHGLVTHMRSTFGTAEPWVAVIDPIPISDLIKFRGDNADTTKWLEPILALERSGQDTQLLRTPAALEILLDRRLQPDQRVGSLAGLVEEFIQRRLMLNQVSFLSAEAHRAILSSVCLDHFSGFGDELQGSADTLRQERSFGTERSVSLRWLSRRLPEPYRDLEHAYTFVAESCFLEINADGSRLERASLPQALAYEYFVSRGLLGAMARGENANLSREMLVGLTEGFILAFVLSGVTAELRKQIGTRVLSLPELDPADRLFCLYLLEDSPTYGPLLRSSPAEYLEWLSGFVEGEAPNTHCWKIAAYQLLAVGRLDLKVFISEIMTEPPEERSIEYAIQRGRAGGDIDRQLIDRMQSADLFRCRGVTAVRMGDFGSLDCIIPLARALSERKNSDYENELFLSQLSRIVVRENRVH